MFNKLETHQGQGQDMSQTMPTSGWHCEKLLPINIANRRRERCLPQPASCRKRGEHGVCFQTDPAECTVAARAVFSKVSYSYNCGRALCEAAALSRCVTTCCSVLLDTLLIVASQALERSAFLPMECPDAYRSYRLTQQHV